MFKQKLAISSISISTSTSHVILSLSKDHSQPSSQTQSETPWINAQNTFLKQTQKSIFYALKSKFLLEPWAREGKQTIISSEVEKSFNFNFNFEFNFNFPRHPEPVEGSKDASLCYRSVLHDNTKNTNTRTLKTENWKLPTSYSLKPTT